VYPEIFSIGSLTIQGYGLMIFIGVIVAYLFMAAHLKSKGFTSETVSELFLWCFFTVFIGGKLFYWLEDPGKYLDKPALLLEDPGNGFVFYGSFLATIPVLIWWFRKKQLPVWEMFDLVGIAGAFVHAFGKLGCFMAGCCHGKVCNASVGVVFTHPNSHADPLNTPLYPTQLWDAGILFTAIGLMFFLKPRKWFQGQLFLLYGMFYAVGRFITEKYRGDEERGFVFNGLLSHSQAIALAVFAVCAVVAVYRFKTERIRR
jgi:phosphatidylglycerol:prolipoprotein diacylglycerol transferase